MAWPISFIAEWVIGGFFWAFFLIAFKGRVAMVYSIIFPILSLPILIGRQYFLLDNGTTLTETTFQVYPTSIVLFFLVIHITLITTTIELIFTDMDRNWYGKPNPQPRR